MSKPTTGTYQMLLEAGLAIRRQKIRDEYRDMFPSPEDSPLLRPVTGRTGVPPTIDKGFDTARFAN